LLSNERAENPLGNVRKNPRKNVIQHVMISAPSARAAMMKEEAKRKWLDF